MNLISKSKENKQQIQHNPNITGLLKGRGKVDLNVYQRTKVTAEFTPSKCLWKTSNADENTFRNMNAFDNKPEKFSK